MRKAIAAVIWAFISAGNPLPAAPNNPVPFVNSPLSPSVALPGAPGFTLTVTGAGFVPGSVVMWNGNSRATTFASKTSLTAAITASDIATAGTIPVTVSNPAPGGGISNAVVFEVTTPTNSLAFTRTESTFPAIGFSEVAMPSALAVGYLPGHAVPYLAIANAVCPAAFSCLLQKATIATVGDSGTNGTFTGANPAALVTGDLNGDGIFDLLNLGQSISVSLGNGDNTFKNHQDVAPPPETIVTSTPVLGDFNLDGKLDLVLATITGADFLPGKGDGTFGTPVPLNTSSFAFQTQVIAGDFNRDGILDLAVSNSGPSGGTISILLGNGDGTFQPQIDIPDPSSPGQLIAADFNGDGKLDLAALNIFNPTISIFLGNGDGTFGPAVNYAAGMSPSMMAAGDFNGDGVVDFAITDSQCTTSTCPASGSVNLILGNRDGTFGSPLDFATLAQPGAMATGEFSYFSTPVGRSGIAVANTLENSVSVFAQLPSQNQTSNPLPTISSISPVFVIQNSGALTLTVNGTNFVSGSQVSFGGTLEPTTFVSATQLTAAIPANLVGIAGVASVLVSNPSPGGGNSTTVSFNIYLPPPTISSINPPSVVAGSPGFTLTVTGANFVSSSMLNFNGVSRPATFVSSTQLTTAIAASEIASPATIGVTVSNTFGLSGSGGGTSSSATLTILASNSQPTVGALSPASATAGSAQFTLMISGTGFGPSSVVTFGSVTVTSAYVSPTQLSASIPASAIAVGGTPFVTVVNPGGSPSVVTTFTVNNPFPTIGSLSPTSVAPNSASLTLNVSGTNFNSSSKVLVNGSPLPTTLINATTLTATIPATDFSQSGTLSITVSNPTPSGGTTGALAFTVADYSVTVPSASNTVAAGATAKFSLMLVPLNGTLGESVAFANSALPAGTVATFNPASLPSGTPSTAVTLSISTTPHSYVTSQGFFRRVWPRSPFGFSVALVLWLMTLGFCFATGRRRMVAQLLAILFLLISTGLTACGGGASTSAQQFNPATGTPAGTYMIVVTATSASASLTTMVTLTIQ